MESTVTSWGYSVLSSGGTATAALTTVVNRNNRLRISGIVIAGAASTDIITVTDANNVQIVLGACTDINHPFIASFPNPIVTDGLKVGAAGATTGSCCIFLSK